MGRTVEGFGVRGTGDRGRPKALLRKEIKFWSVSYGLEIPSKSLQLTGFWFLWGILYDIHICSFSYTR